MEEIKNLSINTLKVEIKTLSIGGKQMTLSVFKQIPFLLVSSLNEDDDIILGWVKYKMQFNDYFLIVIRNGILYKGSFHSPEDFPNDQLYISV